MESSVGLSTDQSSCSEGLLFSAREVEDSDNEEENHEQKNANLDAVVPCSQPYSNEGMGHQHHSPLKNVEDESVNSSGRQVRAASLGAAQYLQPRRLPLPGGGDTGIPGIEGAPLPLEEETGHPRVPCRLDIVLVQGGELTGDEVVEDLQAEVDEKEQKKLDAERRKKEREHKRD